MNRSLQQYCAKPSIGCPVRSVSMSAVTFATISIKRGVASLHLKNIYCVCKFEPTTPGRLVRLLLGGALSPLALDGVEVAVQLPLRERLTAIVERLEIIRRGQTIVATADRRKTTKWNDG